MFKTFRIQKFDFALTALVIALNVIGVFAIASAEPDLVHREQLGMAVSLAFMLAVSLADYHKILKFYWILYALNLAVLLAVILIGSTGGGAQRWVNIGGVRFQPSETAKIILILFFAQFIMKHKDKMKTFPMIAACLLLITAPFVLVFKQPDLSTSVMIFIIFCAIMFVAGISWKLIVGLLVAAVPAAVILFNMVLQEGQTILSSYQQGRILAWLHPERYENDLAYQTMNSIMAIGSGQLLGKGYNTNEISSLLNSGYISESQTDFIFTVIGEEFGFLGSVSVVILITLISLSCLRIARNAPDIQGKIIATGMAAWIGFQGFMNIGVATGILPNTGIPLPFVSYGLTSLISLYAGIGFVLNVNMQSGRRLQTEDTLSFIEKRW
ncbi:MAG: rod shape-determining protein RodA [Lachnospiraceae bacterium]|jgi:rod shape determining protein RodA|nr:rod shape-determining protein RodA [Lachnospiraceae bacterium]